MKRLRVAVLGCGDHARLWHLKQYAAMPDVELVAAVDVDAERARAAAAEFGAAAWFTDHQVALEASRPELVSIVSPPAVHHRQALDAFSVGAHVLCEKPIALNAGQAREMVAASAAAGRFLSMGFQNRHLETSRILRRTLAEGKLGRPFFSRVWCGHVMNIPGWGHFHRKSLAGGGVVMATAVHFLDAALWVLGNPEIASVTGFTYAKTPHMREPAVTWKGPVGDFEVEDFAHAVIRFADDARMSVESDWLMHPGPRPCGLEVLTTDARLSLFPLRFEVEHGVAVEDVTPAFEENSDPVTSFLREAVDCALHGGEPVVRPEQIIQVQAVMDAIYESARTGREVLMRPANG